MLHLPLPCWAARTGAMVQDSPAQVASSSSGYAAGGSGAAAISQGAAASRAVEVLRSQDGDVVGLKVSQAAQLYTTVDRIINSQRILSLPVADRFTLAGKVAAAPEEHARLVERLSSAVATSLSEAGALNALYLLKISKELVPGFKEKIPEGRLESAAELSPHKRAQDAVLRGEDPKEWALADQQGAGTQIVLLPQMEEEPSLLDDAATAVGDATKFVGGAAFGGVGLVTDTLGITRNAEETLAGGAEDAVDLVSDSMTAVVGTIDEGLSGTADDLAEKGVVNTVGDGMADAVDMVSDFVGDAVLGIAGGVGGVLDWVTEAEPKGQQPAMPATHKVAIVVAELFGEERSLGLRIENRVVTNFTKPEAAKLGWKLGDCILGVNLQQATTQETMLEAIGQAKETLKTNGAPIRFLVERLGARP